MTIPDEAGKAPVVDSRVVLAALGLACYLATLVFYSPTITPFQDLAGLNTFLEMFAPRSVAFGAVVAAVLAVADMRGVRVPPHVMGIGGGALYVLCALLFALSAVWGFPFGGTEPVVTSFSFLSALGAVLLGLAWGRVFKGFGRRRSLAGVALAALFQAALCVVFLLAPQGVEAAVYCVAAVACAALPSFLGMEEPAGDRPGSSAGNDVASFIAVAAPAAIGLFAFAFVMGTMRDLIIETYPMHIGSLVVGAVVLGAFACLHLRNTVSSVAYRTLIPILAVLLLAESNVSLALFGGSPVDMVMIFLLYTLAALFTLSTLAAVAHAGEFSSDFVFAAGIGLFCLASFAGLMAAWVMSEEAIKVSTTLITTAYAFAMVALPSVHASRISRWQASHESFERSIEGLGPAEAEGSDLGVADASAASTGDELRARCDEVASAAHLTARETEILVYLAQGYGGGYIGEALYISPNTVRTHVHNIYRKLDVSTREEIIELARGVDA